ncbi:hypothetical protein [Saliphagus sp. WLHSJ1]|uniref:hypothetical protein n=1 Tax=Natronosalvus amylolyticus TaxID=2961994 RepID=UPI0020C95B3A
MIGGLPAVQIPVLPRVGGFLYPFPVQPHDIGWRLIGERRLCQRLDHGVLPVRASSEQVGLPAAPCTDLINVRRLHIGVSHRIALYHTVVNYIERGPELRPGYELLVWMIVVQLASDLSQRLGLPRRMRFAENGYRRIILLELVHVAIHIRITEIVVKDNNRQVNVRIVLTGVRIILPDARCIPELVRIGRIRVPVKKPDVVCLLRCGVVDPISLVFLQSSRISTSSAQVVSLAQLSFNGVGY